MQFQWAFLPFVMKRVLLKFPNESFTIRHWCFDLYTFMFVVWPQILMLYLSKWSFFSFCLLSWSCDIDALTQLLPLCGLSIIWMDISAQSKLCIDECALIISTENTWWNCIDQLNTIETQLVRILYLFLFFFYSISINLIGALNWCQFSRFVCHKSNSMDWSQPVLVFLFTLFNCLNVMRFSILIVHLNYSYYSAFL